MSKHELIARSSLITLMMAASSAMAEPFVEIEAEGLDFVHANGMTGQRYFAEMMGAGVALFDYDGDGDLDIYLVQGSVLEPGAGPDQLIFSPKHQPPFTDRLYRNDSPRDTSGRVLSLRFTDVTEEIGLTPGRGYGMGVATGDYDGDGRTDLYITALGPNRLLRNTGSGFEDVTAEAGVDDDRWSVPATFFDADGDGDLDLYVGNYVDFTVDDHKDCRTSTGVASYCSPLMYRPYSDRLFENLGDGRFRDVTGPSGLASSAGGALGAIASDLDSDGDLDLYVANDGVPNHLWLNQGGLRFIEDAVLAGVAVDRNGMPEASMGVDAADFDGDGDEDLFMTHLARQTNTLYINDGSGWFDDSTLEFGLADASFAYTGFGTAWSDHDNDGDLDLISVNGEVVVPVDRADQGPLPLDQPNQLFRNLGGGRYADISRQAGAAFARSEVSRGLAMGDLDDDGDADAIVTNNAGPVRLLLNIVGQDKAWIGLHLDPRGPMRHDLGAVAQRLDEDGRVIATQRVRTAGSYVSARDPRLIFGLGEDPGAVRVRVTWSDGETGLFGPLASGRYHRLRQGEGGG